MDKEENRVGYVVKEKVGEIEEDTRKGRIRRTIKEVVGCVQDMVGKKRFLVQFGDGQRKDTSSSLLVFLISKKEVEMDEPLSNYPEKEQGELLIIDGNHEVGEPCMFGRGMYLYMIYFLCYVEEMSKDFWRNRCRKREIRTYTRRRIPEWMKLGTSIEEIFLRKVTIGRRSIY